MIRPIKYVGIFHARGRTDEGASDRSRKSKQDSGGVLKKDAAGSAQLRFSLAPATTFCQAAFFVRAKLTDRKEEEEANGAQRSQLNYSRLSISLGSGALKAFSRPQVS